MWKKINENKIPIPIKKEKIVAIISFEIKC